MEEIDMQVQEAQRVANKMNAKRPTQGCIIIKTPTVNDKERILKAAREKQLSTREFPLDYELISQKRPYRQEGAGKKYSKS